jgi:hypothetical protein
MATNKFIKEIGILLHENENDLKQVPGNWTGFPLSTIICSAI